MTYEIRSFAADGTQDLLIPGVKAEVTDELFDAGYVKMSGPHDSVGVARLRKRMEVALFLDGDEIDNTRALVREYSGNPSSGQDAPGLGDEVTFGGQTMYSLFEKAIVYPANWPDLNPPYHDFNNETPGTILRTLIQRAQARGALPWLEIGDWDGHHDINGVAWPKTASLRYEPGVTYQSVLENMARLGICEWRMSGRKLVLYAPETAGTDRTVGDDPVILRRGRDVTDTPESESTVDLANVVLVVGGTADGGDSSAANIPIIFEQKDDDSIALYGREESSLSEGSTQDEGTLATLADASLKRYSEERGEYTTKFTPETDGPAPWVDFYTGDWVYLDRDGVLNRYRVRQLSITTDDDGQYEVIATLNDKFAELDLLMAKKVEGIIGGAGNDTVNPAPPDNTDYTIPSPPTGVGVDTSLYNDPTTGLVKGLATGTWLAPETNTDGTAITDLSHYEVEHQTDGKVTWSEPDGFGPAHEARDIDLHFDRTGATEDGWVGADGGGNFQADDHDVVHVWGDTLWGRLSSTGQRINVTMPRNTATRFDPSTTYGLTSYAAAENLIPADAAHCDDPAEWDVDQSVFLYAVDWDGGLRGKALQATMEADGTAASTISVGLTQTYDQDGSTWVSNPITGGATYRLMLSFANIGAWRNVTARVVWYGAGNTQVGKTADHAPDEDGRIDVFEAAPASAITGDFYLDLSGCSDEQIVRFTRPAVIQTSHRMQSWRAADTEDVVYNEVLNPDGADIEPGPLWVVNWAKNPGLYQDTSGITAIGGASVSRDPFTVPGATDDALSITNPQALDGWRQALADVGTDQANWVAVGDSVTAGLLTDDWHNRYQTRLFNRLRREYAVSGVLPNDGTLGWEGMQGFIPGYNAAYPFLPQLPGDDGQGSGGGHKNDAGLAAQAITLEGGAYRRFTATVSSFTMQYISDETWGAPILVTIDGTQHFTIDGKQTGDTNVDRMWDSPALDLGQHVIEVRNPLQVGAWGSSQIAGFFLYAGDEGKGVHVLDGSISGGSAQQFMLASGSLADGIAEAVPDLVSIFLGYNDAGAGRTPAQFKTDLQGLVDAVTASCTAKNGKAPTVLLIGGYDPGDAAYGAAGSQWPNPWPDYLAVMRDVANGEPDRIAMVDLSERMPVLSDDTTGLYDGSIHPTDKGHAMIADLLDPVVSGYAGKGSMASAMVDVPDSKQGGIQVAPNPDADWASQTKWGWFVAVKVPTGKTVDVIGSVPGTGDVVAIIDGNDDWQGVPISGTMPSGGTEGPTLKIVAHDNLQGAFRFHATQFDLATAAVSQYVDGSTEQDLFYATWAGDVGEGPSTIYLAHPVGWTTDGIAYTTGLNQRYNPTSVMASGNVSVPTSAPAGEPVTVACWMKAVNSAFDAVARVSGASGPLLEQTTHVPDDGQWHEVRCEGVPAEAVTGCGFTAMQTAYVAELTQVNGYWPGSTFTGSSENEQSIECSWEGAANKSRSVSHWPNSNVTLPGHPFWKTPADAPLQLFTPATAGAPAAEWAWPADGDYTTGNKAVVLYEGVMSDASVRTGWNFAYDGTFYIAEFDLGAKAMTRVRQWCRDPRGGHDCISWGGAVHTDGGYTYIYGSKQVDGGFENYVCRATARRAYQGPYQVWSGGKWVDTDNDPGVWRIDGPVPDNIGTTTSSGISSVRTLDGQWEAFATGGFDKTLDLWTAPAATGPFTNGGSIFTYPNPDLLAYSAKFLPGCDANSKGYAMQYCSSSADSVVNPSKYYPTFIRGPKGKAVAGGPGVEWKDRGVWNTPPSRYSLLEPGSIYAMRVRAVDSSDNKSDWVVSDPVMVEADEIGPEKPSTPIVEPLFQGIRIRWDGLDYRGVAQVPDFDFYEVHVSTAEGFIPDATTLVDRNRVQGGTSVVTGIGYDQTYWARIVAVDVAGNRSPASDAASATPERLSDPDLPDKLITGAKIADHAINVSNLTVGAFSDNLIPGGNMEEDHGGLPTGWTTYFSEHSQFDSTNPIAGSASLRMDVTDQAEIVRTTSAFPVTPGDVYYVSAKVRTTRDLDAADVSVSFSVADTEDKAGSGFGQDTVILVGATTGGPGVVTIEAGVETPLDETLRWGRIVVRAETEATPYSAWLDDVEVRKITGEAAIANASINRAKIRDLAVDDAKIANMSASKLTVGFLQADVTVSARIKTDDTGQRVEINRDGLQAFNPGLPGSDDIHPVTEVGTDGGLVSRWLRTSTTGTRIEMGLYSTGKGSANIAFYPDSKSWEFPPGVGFGGDYTANWIPGMGMYSGSLSTANYNKYGLSQIAVDQVGGIHLDTGDLLDGSHSTKGAPIKLNATGDDGYIALTTDATTSVGWGRSHLYLSPNDDTSRLVLHGGTLHIDDIEPWPDGMGNNIGRSNGPWLDFNAFHMVITCGNGVRFTHPTNGDYFTINTTGIIHGNGDWGVPRIGTRATKQHYASWDSNGNCYVGSNADTSAQVKSFVIDHPVDDDKYLVHACVEGPEARVEYEGRDRLRPGADGQNEATITLPAYFSALVDEDTATVQITPVLGDCGPDCEYRSAPSMAATRVRDGQFTVKAVAGPYHPCAPFSWRVTAARKDATFQVEPSKSETVVRGDGPYTWIGK